MKRRNIFVSLCILICSASSLGEVEDRHLKKHHESRKHSSEWMFHWGPKAGMDFLEINRPFSFSNRSGSEMGIGLGAGLNARFEWKSKFYIQPGLMLSYDAASASASDPLDSYEDISPYYKITRASLMLPLHLGYKFYVTTDLYMALFTGAWASYGFAGSADFNSGSADFNESEKIHSLYGTDGIWSRFGVGAAFGMTFDIGPRLSVNVDAYLGLKSMANKPVFYTDYMSESLARISLCYWVGSYRL